LVDDEADVDVAWLRNASVVGLTAGASAPDELVHRLVAALGALGAVEVEERTTTTESVQFRLPREVRPA
jgi:4-hydroxy-3-methylbut-2-enyl diphosphate reductase